MEAAASTQASALRGCSGRSRSERSQDSGWGGEALRRTLTWDEDGGWGQSWQVQVGGAR